MPASCCVSRRQLIHGSLGVAGVGFLAGCAMPRLPWQPVPPARLGYLGANAPDLLATWREGLREQGYVDGQNLLIEYRFTDGRLDQGPALAADLLPLPDHLNDANGAEAAAHARQTTDTVPIVGTPLGSDPLGAGLVASLAHPGGNVTGVSTLGSATVAKRLQLLQEAIPHLTRAAVLWNPNNAGKVTEWQTAQEVARRLGVFLVAVEARQPVAVAEALQTIGGLRAEALLVLQDNLLLAHRASIAEFALEHRLPSIYELREYTEVGGLLAYGVNRLDAWRRAAGYAGKILKGAKPGELPVEQPTTFDFILNLKTAHALGLTIPRSVLEQATEVIQ